MSFRRLYVIKPLGLLHHIQSCPCKIFISMLTTTKYLLIVSLTSLPVKSQENKSLVSYVKYSVLLGMVVHASNPSSLEDRDSET